MKKFFFFLTILLMVYFFKSFAQNFTISNQKTLGGSSTEFATDVLQLLDSSYLVCGYSFSGVSGDKTEASRGLNDYWIVNLNSSLTVNWQKTYGGDSSDAFPKIIQTIDENIILAGTSNSSVSGDKTALKKGISDFWLLKIDMQGNILWQKTYGGTGFDEIASIIEFPDGSLLLAGTSNSDISGDKTDTSRGFSDYWLIKTDSAGNIIWDKTLGGSDSENLLSVTLTSDQAIILSGNSWSNASGEKSENAFGLNDIWVVKLGANGNILWDKTIGGSGSDDLGYVEINNNYIYIISQSFSDISGTKTENSKGQSDYWIIKLDNNGNILWDKTIGGSNYDIPHSITVTSDEQLLLSGESWSNISGDKNENSKGIYDFWLISIDTTGNINWQKTIGGFQYDWLATTIEISKDHYLLVGSSESNSSGDKTENSRGQQDYWIVNIEKTLAIDENRNGFNITVAPNFVTEGFNFQFESNKNIITQFFILDISGKQIQIYQQRPYLNGKHQIYIQTSQLPSGLYFFLANMNEQRRSFKIIKE